MTSPNVAALSQLLEAEREESREREGTLRSSERRNKALREENGALRELMAAQREELRSLKQQGGHVNDGQKTEDQLADQLEELKAQLRTATNSLVLAKAWAGAKEALTGALIKDITAVLSRLAVVGKIGWRPLAGCERRVKDSARPITLSDEEIERVMDGANLDREAVRPRLAAVFANGRNSIASGWNLRRNRLAHTGAAIDVALYLKLHREDVLRVTDEDTYEVVNALYPEVYGVSPNSDEQTLLSLSEGRRYASIRRLAEPWPRLSGLVQEEEKVEER